MGSTFSFPEKERAVVAYLAMRGFAGIPRHARPYPEAFTDTLAAIAYAAAWQLDHQGQAITVYSIKECVEKNRHWIRRAEAEVKVRGFVDWTQILTDDDSLTHQPPQAVVECLADIAEAARRREAVEIYDKGKAGEISPAEAIDALTGIESASRAHSWDADLIAAEELCDDKNAESYKDAPAIIEGMLAQGDLALITAGSKSFKSWIALQIALCAANGIPFLDRKTTQTKTLVLNFELKPASIKKRLLAIAYGLKCGKKHLYTWNLRNRPITPAFLARLTEKIKEAGFKLIILDPLYSMYGVVDDPNVENSNPAMTALLSTIRAACEAAGAAVVIVHHHSKGDSSAKASIDRASGAGALGRFPDSVMSLVRHESPDAYVVGIDFRDFPPCEPFVIRRDHYIMVLDPDLDPTAKKVAKPPTNQKVSIEDVLAFLPTDGKAIQRHALEKTIAIKRDCTRDTAKRWVSHAIALKVCFANRHGICRPKQEVQTHF